MCNISQIHKKAQVINNVLQAVFYSLWGFSERNKSQNWAFCEGSLVTFSTDDKEVALISCRLLYLYNLTCLQSVKSFLL